MIPWTCWKKNPVISSLFCLSWWTVTELKQRESNLNQLERASHIFEFASVHLDKNYDFSIFRLFFQIKSGRRDYIIQSFFIGSPVLLTCRIFPWTSALFLELFSATLNVNPLRSFGHCPPGHVFVQRFVFSCAIYLVGRFKTCLLIVGCPLLKF